MVLLAGLSSACDDAPSRELVPPTVEPQAAEEPPPPATAAFEAPSIPSAPIRVLEQVGPAVRDDALGYAEVHVRVESVASHDVETLSLVVYVLDDAGALAGERRGSVARDLDLLPAHATRTVRVVVSLDDRYRTTSLDHLVFSPSTVQFCDDSTWMADLGRTIPTGRAARCPSEAAEGEVAPDPATARPGQLIGAGYSVVVPVGYAEDRGHPLYSRGVRAMRRSGQYDRFISIAPAQPTVSSPGEWENLEPSELDLARCRGLLPAMRDATFAIERTESVDVRMCVARQDQQIVRIIVTSHIDYRMLCWTGGDADVAEACDEVAHSWRHR